VNDNHRWNYGDWAAVIAIVVCTVLALQLWWFPI